MSEALHADIFIVPGGPLQILCDRLTDPMYCYDAAECHGFKVCFRACITDKTTGKWYSVPGTNCPILSEYFPINRFYGKKEGDVVEVTLFDKRVVLTLAQQSYQYQSYGNFEDLLYRLTASYSGVTKSHPYTPITQIYMFLNNHVTYANMVGKPVCNPLTFQSAEMAANYMA